MTGSGIAGLAAAGLVVVLSLWVADRSVLRLEAVNKASEGLAQRNEALAEQGRTLAAALSGQEALRAALTDISRQTRKTQSALDGQTAQLNRDLAELKRTDEQTNAYLSGLVPAALGLRYIRPDTTDPVAYRAGGIGVRADAVPASGASRSDP
ncbi:hypothetical protein AUC61_23975 [Pseudomonas sp. S25]|uniref:DNA recombination protein RmuC n=1 Tax=Pseudomonas maioricensis TaxID=1766623 RepID=A0ABS9ZPU0_9PSED|nr:hypothetical protein [Pseudomonas sp. S25]MCI8212594.1 hypothetical protein [Pseudomonas sp. S25]